MKRLLFIITALILAMCSQAQHTITVKHTYYTLEYDTVLKSPLVSWYVQTTAHATSTHKIDRKNVAAFHQDPLIAARYQVANDEEYRDNNCYDKGHISPYTAFDFDITAAKESMYYTNTAPQYSFFNRHPWERLEQYILKQIAPTTDSVFVYTGCLYGTKKMKNVPVPDYYWKVIEYKNGEECWLAPNMVTTSTDYSSYHIQSQELKQKIHSYYPTLIIPFQ